MEANELRIGNLTLKFNAINEIDADDITRLCGGNFTDSYKPIPLNEEWLLKFGFEKEVYKDVPCFKIEDLWLYEGFGNKFVVYGIYSLIRSIKQVHQLQNLYFALTGEELTIKTH